MEYNPITFVTSFIKIYDTILDERTIEWRFNKFRDIAETGIPICVFVSPDCHDMLSNFTKNYTNVKIMKPVSLSETFVAKQLQCIEYKLPEYRNTEKDTAEFLMLMNAKTEFLHNVAIENPWNSTHFAWIDFSISYIFKNKIETLEYLRILARRKFTDEPFLLIPGCWDKGSEKHLLNLVIWRFCGGFLLGDKQSIIDFHQLYKQYYLYFIEATGHLVWEVNFWAWLEINTEWSPRWYVADHNDSIFKIPTDVFSRSLNEISTKTVYSYPKIDGFVPMQAAHVCLRGRHYLNTRYVNYLVLEKGHFKVSNEGGVIISKNVVSELDPVTNIPIDYHEMNENTVGLTSKSCQHYGLEDIRLYNFNNQIRFIATNINYSPHYTNSMIVGDYHAENRSYLNCRTARSPYGVRCEKNWIPIIRHNDNDEEFFIYKWYPMEIGKLDETTNELTIMYRYPIHAPDFHRARGSTVFIDRGDYLVGVVHFSEESTPRKYYHMLVALDKSTLQPVKYSETFHFQRVGIEFCTGFTIRDMDYIFWISVHDCDATMVSIAMDQIPLCYEF